MEEFLKECVTLLVILILWVSIGVAVLWTGCMWLVKKIGYKIWDDDIT